MASAGYTRRSMLPPARPCRHTTATATSGTSVAWLGLELGFEFGFGFEVR